MATIRYYVEEYGLLLERAKRLKSMIEKDGPHMRSNSWLDQSLYTINQGLLCEQDRKRWGTEHRE